MQRNDQTVEIDLGDIADPEEVRLDVQMQTETEGLDSGNKDWAFTSHSKRKFDEVDQDYIFEDSNPRPRKRRPDREIAVESLINTLKSIDDRDDLGTLKRRAKIKLDKEANDPSLHALIQHGKILPYHHYGECTGVPKIYKGFTIWDEYDDKKNNIPMAKVSLAFGDIKLAKAGVTPIASKDMDDATRVAKAVIEKWSIIDVSNATTTTQTIEPDIIISGSKAEFQHAVYIFLTAAYDRERLKKTATEATLMDLKQLEENLGNLQDFDSRQDLIGKIMQKIVRKTRTVRTNQMASSYEVNKFGNLLCSANLTASINVTLPEHDEILKSCKIVNYIFSRIYYSNVENKVDIFREAVSNCTINGRALTETFDREGQSPGELALKCLLKMRGKRCIRVFFGRVVVVKQEEPITLIGRNMYCVISGRNLMFKLPVSREIIQLTFEHKGKVILEHNSETVFSIHVSAETAATALSIVKRTLAWAGHFPDCRSGSCNLSLRNKFHLLNVADDGTLKLDKIGEDISIEWGIGITSDLKLSSKHRSNLIKMKNERGAELNEDCRVEFVPPKDGKQSLDILMLLQNEDERIVMPLYPDHYDFKLKDIGNVSIPVLELGQDKRSDFEIFCKFVTEQLLVNGPGYTRQYFNSNMDLPVFKAGNAFVTDDKFIGECKKLCMMDQSMLSFPLMLCVGLPAIEPVNMPPVRRTRNKKTGKLEYKRPFTAGGLDDARYPYYIEICGYRIYFGHSGWHPMVQLDLIRQTIKYNFDVIGRSIRRYTISFKNMAEAIMSNPDPNDSVLTAYNPIHAMSLESIPIRWMMNTQLADTEDMINRVSGESDPVDLSWDDV